MDGDEVGGEAVEDEDDDGGRIVKEKKEEMDNDGHGRLKNEGARQYQYSEQKYVPYCSHGNRKRRHVIILRLELSLPSAES